MARAVVAGLLLTCASAITSPRLLPVGHASLSTIAIHRYSQDCFKRSTKYASLVQKDEKPGAGMTPSEYKPFENVLKDGFFNIDCAKDMLFHEGDKFGDGKFSYKLADVSNVSIVHYSSIVAKEDREEMSQDVCFGFCRTLPDMHFFGIVNGRDCYCAPYYSPMAGDSSDCDAVCPGKPTEFCGGKFKSSVFEMHDCADSLKNLAAAVPKVEEAKTDLKDISDTVAALGSKMQKVGTFWQEVTGAIGQPAPSNLMQAAKVFAGELVHAAEAADKLGLQIDGVKAKGQAILDSTKTNPDSYEATSKMEDLTRQASELSTKADEMTEKLEDLAQLASPQLGDTTDAAKQYYPLTYFVDKKIEEKYSVCGGSNVKRPIVNTTQDGCARACDAAVHDCVGFSFFQIPGQTTVCFLFSKFKTLKYVIDCPKFLQSSTDPAPKPVSKIGCFGKLSEFPSSIAPQASGKCDGCLRDAQKFCAK